MQNAGKLIMLDGPDGVGKTTQFTLLAEALEEQGYDVYSTHLLGGTDIGEALRSVVFSDSPRPALTNLHINLAIYYALAQKISEEKTAGKVVLVDRSPLSLVAYQVYGDGLDKAIGLAACTETLQAFSPDLLVVYSAPLEILQARREQQQKQKASDYFEQQQLEYHKRTTQGYVEAAEQYQALVLDASGDRDTIHTKTLDLVNKLLPA